jgi:hypothetical protein
MNGNKTKRDEWLTVTPQSGQIMPGIKRNSFWP